ncbi:MAG: response regulator [Chloroflexota bacterium]|nr:response regulator [Chloroflexota bacterium]MDE3192375.1 response regulator [Chloroflexota bacterium]
MTIRTLVVDDDFRVADVHRGFLERLPAFATVGVAHTAAQALAMADELRPDLVLLDIYLPDRSGLEVLRELRAPGRPPVDVIAITAAKDVETLRAALRSGIAHYLVKPFQFNAFREKLESYAAAHARLARPGDVDQSEVDRIVGLLRADTVSALPKGLSTATLELVARTVQGARGDLSAVDLAQATGISRVTARRYLEHLARSGLVTISMRYGSAGRPEHRYHWTRTAASAEPA